ncbi:hypothetical protein BJY01DRAFT_261600 [Aspergillus pseudoustus]|uniref:N-acetyltransferase domain-containing protein n=1 Tax=Aspergillus pseudoustus TaxID=1810923 RepID=A0ABR4IKP2_9EURO
MATSEPPPTHLKILQRDWAHPDAEFLRRLQREEINAVFGLDNGGEPGTPPSAADISVFLVAYLVPSNSDHGPAPAAAAASSSPLPIACGALRVLPRGDDIPGDVEVKRMENGWMRVVLETGNLLAAAIRFYQREGYLPVEKFGAYRDNEASLCFGKVLE